MGLAASGRTRRKRFVGDLDFGRWLQLIACPTKTDGNPTPSNSAKPRDKTTWRAHSGGSRPVGKIFNRNRAGTLMHNRAAALPADDPGSGHVTDRFGT